MSEEPTDEPTSPLFGQLDAAAKRGARQRDRVRREEEEAREFWRAVLKSPVGRRELWRILEMGHAFEERFAIDGIREKTWVLAGEQRLAFRLFSMWRRFDFDGVALMQRENDPDVRREESA
jgi:hypothetical protein